MKNESNQDIRSSGIISVIVLLSICALTASPLWGSKSKEQKEISLRRAESLAYQIIEIQKSKNSVPSDEGHIGLDPWGQPYQFQVVNHDGARRVFVWSLGPDHQAQTNPSSLDSSRGPASIQPKNEDLSVAIDFKESPK